MLKAKNVTIKDVANLAKVSIASASRAITGNGRISIKTKEKIIKAANQLNYIPNIGARILATRKTQTLGLLFLKLNESHQIDLINEINDAAYINNYQIMISCNLKTQDEIKNIIFSMRGRIDFLIIITEKSAINLEFLDDGILPKIIINSDDYKKNKGHYNFKEIISSFSI